LSHAYCLNYLCEFGLKNAPLDKAEQWARRAIDLDHSCQMAHLSEALLLFFQYLDEQCLTKVRMTIALNPYNAFVTHCSAFLICMLGYWVEGMQLWERAMQLNPRLLSIDWFVPSVYYYFHGDYEKSWEYASQIKTPIWWTPLIRAVVAAQLGHDSKAKTALQEMLEMKQDFLSRAREAIRPAFHLENHIEQLMDGLSKAGLELVPLEV
jgi:adenylate cyclase